ncbi:MAG: hypothetical protein ACRDJL_07035 [Actinomycetota bacterium]
MRKRDGLGRDLELGGMAPQPQPRSDRTDQQRAEKRIHNDATRVGRSAQVASDEGDRKHHH